MEFQNMQHVELPDEVPEIDGLVLMLDLQAKINQSIYPIVMQNLNMPYPTNNMQDITLAEKETLTKEYLLAIIRECAETLDMLNSKPWKETKKKIDLREIKFEFIDIHKFLNSLYDIWGMDRTEVLRYYVAKHKEVQRRVDDGY